MFSGGQNKHICLAKILTRKYVMFGYNVQLYIVQFGNVYSAEIVSAIFGQTLSSKIPRNTKCQNFSVNYSYVYSTHWSNYCFYYRYYCYCFYCCYPWPLQWFATAQQGQSRLLLGSHSPSLTLRCVSLEVLKAGLNGGTGAHIANQIRCSWPATEWDAIQNATPCKNPSIPYILCQVCNCVSKTLHEIALGITSIVVFADF